MTPMGNDVVTDDLAPDTLTLLGVDLAELDKNNFVF